MSTPFEIAGVSAFAIIVIREVLSFTRGVIEARGSGKNGSSGVTGALNALTRGCRAGDHAPALSDIRLSQSMMEKVLERQTHILERMSDKVDDIRARPMR